jgi:glycosyltransferase involved in cell wall biosynthesis
VNITLIIPTYNNLKHIKNAYVSIRKHYPEVELVILDDGSTDETRRWLEDLDDSNVLKYRSQERVGHTILYDIGIEMASNEVVGILHADMVLGPNYIKNVLKHLKRGKVVCATRIEPPLHPEGKEKIIKDFGLDFDDLNIEAFEEFVLEAQNEYKDQTTRGMFAPWVIYKDDFQAIGGHDPGFAPFPYEDSDIFQRWLLNGYELIQSRDSFVYHLTCRGHRWTGEVGKDDDYFKAASYKAGRNYLRKWGSWVKNDDYQHPAIVPKYDIGISVKNCTAQLLQLLEPWSTTIYIDTPFEEYIVQESTITSYNLSGRVKPYGNKKENEIIVDINGNNFQQPDFQFLQQLPQIIKDNGEVGEFTLGNLQIKIIEMNEYQDTLINIS